MANHPTTEVLVAVEGSVDEVVVRRVLAEHHISPLAVYGRHGKAWLRKHVSGYNQAAERLPWWLILVDLDHETDCAPLLVKDWIPNPAPHMVFRVAVREVESWLFADRERLAKFLAVPMTKVPAHPDRADDPKQTMVSLARTSRKRALQEDRVPRQGSGRHVGPAYASRLMEFISDSSHGWRPSIAALHSESLNRFLRSLQRLSGS
jgi:hypothetical protein